MAFTAHENALPSRFRRTVAPRRLLIRGNGVAFSVRGILQCRRWIIHDDGRGRPAIGKVRHFRHFQVGDGGFAKARQVERREPHSVPPLVDDGLCIPLQWQRQTVQRVLPLYLLGARRRLDDGLNLGRVALVRRGRARQDIIVFAQDQVEFGHHPVAKFILQVGHDRIRTVSVGVPTHFFELHRYHQVPRRSGGIGNGNSTIRLDRGAGEEEPRQHDDR